MDDEVTGISHVDRLKIVTSSGERGQRKLRMTTDRGANLPL
jgi:hypothetical protein